MLTVAPTTDIVTCHALRRAVFIEEQNVDEALEVDGLDARALHVLARLDGAPVGCARILIAGDTAKIGRVCVLGTYRGQGIGQVLMRAALELAQTQPGVLRAKLGSQVHALGFYERLGFRPVGNVYIEAGIAHRDMVRDFCA
jgi:ElaA protein